MASAGRRLFSIFQQLHRSPTANLQARATQACLHQQVKSPQITAEPRVALYDEKVKISLKGLDRLEKITLHGQYLQGKQQDVVFASCGQYTADNEGKVKIWEQPSLGGTYEGIEPMGIVWSLRTAPGQSPQTRMTINFTDRPSLISVKVYSGHLNLDDIYATNAQHQILADVQLERWFKFSDKVTRTEVEHGNVRGVLFLPKGDGPFQGVIDLFGSSGGVIEYRAALLASHGFAALALPYFRYKDLTKSLVEVNFDYFEESMEWFGSHPKVHKRGIGVVSVSKGSEYALCMSAYSNWVKACVCINTLTYFGLNDLYHKGKILIKGSVYDMSQMTFGEGGAADLSKALPFTSEVIPAWQNDTKLLFFVSQDDFTHDINSTDYFMDVCPEEKKQNIEIIKYPRAGHLLDPPYTALCRIAVNRSFGFPFLFGGYPKEHAHAQENAWQHTLDHLRKHIPTS